MMTRRSAVRARWITRRSAREIICRRNRISLHLRVFYFSELSDLFCGSEDMVRISVPEAQTRLVICSSISTKVLPEKENAISVGNINDFFIFLYVRSPFYPLSRVPKLITSSYLLCSANKQVAYQCQNQNAYWIE